MPAAATATTALVAPTDTANTVHSVANAATPTASQKCQAHPESPHRLINPERLCIRITVLALLNLSERLVERLCTRITCSFQLMRKVGAFCLVAVTTQLCVSTLPRKRFGQILLRRWVSRLSRRWVSRLSRRRSCRWVSRRSW
jgi:hypothetical protein